MSSSSSLSCLATVFVNGMGFVTPPPLRHLSPVPSHDERQYRPHVRLQMVVGRRGAQAEGGIKRFGGWGGGRYGCDGNGFFYRRVVHANTHDFEAKKTQGKNRTMQRHGQVFSVSHGSHRGMGNRRMEKSEELRLLYYLRIYGDTPPQFTVY